MGRDRFELTATGGFLHCFDLGRKGRPHLFALLVLLGWIAASSAHSAPLGVDGAPGVRVLPASDILANYTYRAPDGTLLFVDESGWSYALIEDVNDPEIANPGDGSFHPFDEEAVVATIEGLPSNLRASLDVTVYVLPFPRRGYTSSSASDGAVFLCPGVYPIEDGTILRATVTHEVGHVWQRRYLDDTGYYFNEYRSLRGITDTSKYHDGASHAYQPREIFAEDFRVLFGDDLARGTGEVENPELSSPEESAALIEFFDARAADSYHTADVAPLASRQAGSVFPNPATSGDAVTVQFQTEERIAMASSSPSEFDELLVFDVRGRVVARPLLDHSGRFRVEDSWGAGVYWVRSARSSSAPVRLQVLR